MLWISRWLEVSEVGRISIGHSRLRLRELGSGYSIETGADAGVQKQLEQ